MVLGYDFWVWFTARAMTNIICLKNLIRLYWVTYDSKRQTAFIVHWEEFPKYDLLYASMWAARLLPREDQWSGVGPADDLPANFFGVFRVSKNISENPSCVPHQKTSGPRTDGEHHFMQQPSTSPLHPPPGFSSGTVTRNS